MYFNFIININKFEHHKHHENIDLITDELLKQFKSGDELNSLLKQLHKRRIEALLETELDTMLVPKRKNISTRAYINKYLNKLII